MGTTISVRFEEPRGLEEPLQGRVDIVIHRHDSLRLKNER
jgi:hypothetical protein